MPVLPRFFLTVCLLPLAWITCVEQCSAAGLTPVAQWAEPSLAELAHGLPLGTNLQLQGLSLLDGEATTTLEVKKFRVWKPGAKITIVGQEGIEIREPSLRSHFRGVVAGDDSSFVFCSVGEDGTWRALVVTQQRTFVLALDAAGSEESPSPPRVREVDLATDLAPLIAEWSCATDCKAPLPNPFQDLTSPTKTRSASAGRGPLSFVEAEGNTTYAGDVAVDTDWEFFNLFGTVEGATDYVSDLLGATAAIFLRDINTIPQISDLFLYTTGPANDPWTGTDVVTAVFEVRDYWNLNRSDVERSIVHFLTGKPMGGGVAFVGSLCDTAFGYGVSGEISGNFDPDNPLMVLDLFVVAHELGHSFGSPHTHCYNDYPMVGDPPIDTCWGSQDGCYSGTTSVPADGGGILSYCYLQSGGIGNVNLWLGRQGFYGDRSERVPQRMRAYLDSVAACLPEIAGNIFRDGFESGDTASWALTVGED